MTKTAGKRHHVVVRVTHWVNVVALTIMVGSGLRIFNAYPRFAPRGGTFCCYPFHGDIPAWLTFGGWLAGARNWHFAMMWVLAVNGLVYLGWVYLHGEWRDLVPRRRDPRDAWQMLRFYLFLRPDHPPQRKHNALQKLSYFGVPFVALIAILSGLAIWKPVSLGPLTSVLGGYVWARYWHFLAMLALVAFTVVHVVMVVTVDPHSLRSMITGRYDDERSPARRNVRPLSSLPDLRRLLRRRTGRRPPAHAEERMVPPEAGTAVVEVPTESEPTPVAPRPPLAAATEPEESEPEESQRAAPHGRETEREEGTR